MCPRLCPQNVKQHNISFQPLFPFNWANVDCGMSVAFFSFMSINIHIPVTFGKCQAIGVISYKRHWYYIPFSIFKIRYKSLIVITLSTCTFIKYIPIKSSTKPVVNIFHILCNISLQHRWIMIIKKTNDSICFDFIFRDRRGKQNSTIWKYNYTLIQLCHLK